MIRCFSLSIILLFLTGCQFLNSRFPPPEPVTVTEIKVVPLKVYQPPMPNSIQMLDVNWFVLTEENLDEKLQEIRELQSDGLVIFAMTPDDYEKIATNLQELRRYVRQQTNLIVYYRKATTSDTDTTSEDWNSLSKQAP